MGYQHYARTDIETSDPRAIIVLLYEGAIKFANKAADAARANKRREMSEYIQKTQKIIQFLMTSLDFEAGGEVADNLDNLYAYMRDTLSQANLRAEVDKIEEVIGLFKPLLEAWRDIAEDPEAAQALANHIPSGPAHSSFDLPAGNETNSGQEDASLRAPTDTQQAENNNGSREAASTPAYKAPSDPNRPSKNSKPSSTPRPNAAAAKAAYGLGNG